MKKIKFITVAFCVLLSLKLYSQQTEKFIDTEKDKKGGIMFARLSVPQPSNDRGNIVLLQELLSLPSNITFKPIDSIIDKTGMVHKAYQQFYKGAKVIGGDYVLHIKNGNIRFINGAYVAVKNDISVAPELSVKDAENFATNEVMKRKTNKANLQLTVTFKEMAFLEDPATEQVRLAFKVFVNATNDIISENEFIDAATGKLLLTENLICSFKPPNAVGSAQTSYSGTQTITTDVIGSQFRMREVRNGSVNILTRNANNSSSFSGIPTSATDVFDNDNNWLANEHGSDRVGYDAHWAAEKSFDYWLTIHGRNSINGAGMNVNSYFHFGSNENNAYWHKTYQSMYFGDGGSLFKPLGSLDVCAHEYGHGITQFTVPGGGLGSSGESPALNEGFSDIWGASVEAWAAPTKQRWLIGEEIMNNGKNSLRNMQNPNDNNSQTQGPDTYQGTNWSNSNAPHTNATLLGHWYYLLTQGGSGTNDIGNSFSVTGIGIDHASKIAYRTEQLLNPSANHAMVRTMSIQAAIDLYGAGSCDEIAVTKAWYAVGIGSNYNTTLTINGDDFVCSTSSNSYIVTGLPAGATVTWSASPTGIVNINSPNSLQTTISKITNGIITLVVTTSNGCVGGFIGSKNIVIGPQTSTNIAGLNPPLGVSPGELLELNVLEGGSSYLWEVEGGTVSGLNNQQSVTIQVNQCPPNITNGYINVHVTITNACGTGNTYTEATTVDCGTGGGFRLSPNPSNGVITVDGQLKNKNIKEIKIADKLGNIKKQLRFSGFEQRVTIDLSFLPTDIYYIQIFDGKTWEAKQISIKR